MILGMSDVRIHALSRCGQPDRYRDRHHRSGHDAGFQDNQWLDGIFLATTALTSITGFLFPSDKVLPSHIGRRGVAGRSDHCDRRALWLSLARSWRWIYVVSALVALYLNVFVLVAQALPEGGHPERAGADAIGSGIHRCFS